MNNKLTLVTGLWDIRRDDLADGFKRDFQHYLDCFARLLAVEYPMVVYVPHELEQFVWQHRNSSNTRIITKSLDDLKTFPFNNEVQSIRQSDSWRNQAGWLHDSPQSQLEHYNLITLQKQFFLNDCSLFNFFDSTHFMWVDAGISNTIGEPSYYFDKDFETKVLSDMNKMLYLAFPYDGTVEVHGFEKNAMNRLAEHNTEYVCRGGIFGGPKHVINEINDKYYGLLKETLPVGLMGTEESLFTILSYRHPQLCNVQMIDSNGLVVTYLNRVKNRVIEDCADPLAFYFLTYNTPQQFKQTIERFIKAYPMEFANTKKYVVDNSTDKLAIKEYKKLFKKHKIEVIHEGINLGIQDGRQLVAEHFGESKHKYHVFFEEDFYLIDKEAVNNKNGFIRYVPNLFDKMITILDEQDLDYLKLTMIEFYGDCTQDWAFKNVPEHRRQEYYPERSDGNSELRWKTKVDYLGFHKDLAYAVGHFHGSNWPNLINKRGNQQMYLAEPYDHKFEQTVMSQIKTFLVDGKLKGACLLAAPIEHDRTIFYDGKTRRENKHFTN